MLKKEIIIPLFPLPNVVMFPDVLLPLHIFEERYREMTKDALERQKLIGMVLLQKGWERDYEGSPPVFPVGCVGEIVQEERLPDGKYNIVLHGLSRFHLQSEIKARTPYRQASVLLMENSAKELENEDTEDLRRKVLAFCAEILIEFQMQNLLPYASSLSAEQLFDTAAFYLNIPVEKKQELLSQSNLLQRGNLLLEIVKERVLLMRYLKRNKDKIPSSAIMN